VRHSFDMAAQIDDIGNVRMVGGLGVDSAAPCLPIIFFHPADDISENCGERGKSEREALPTPYSRSDGVCPAAQSPRAYALERRERHCRKPVDDGWKIFKSTPADLRPRS